jgi:hypothetical protein
MAFDWDQMLAVALLAAAAAVGLGLVALTFRLVSGFIKWALGAETANRPARSEPAAPVALPAQPVCASDLFAVRSNLDAVSRQLEDLEKKLRRAPVPAAAAKSARREGELALQAAR